MSLDQAKAAINKLKTDSSFRDEIMSIVEVNKRIERLNKAGFQCTFEELDQLIALDLDVADLKCNKVVASLCQTVKK
ncbi:Nif11-like leader peptide family RiPP precursor [Prosthecochloris sp. SCSIO W1101]|uniref:Nif11-like leader peptide family RiPP precursor n=1 Tax=Prosthecochloris sp. SCSIO W1101 TaxID=2992242 RepID=UPI00223D1A90|nr:Nif11-like leader peptide family RiPP precursor [Prosthecochloris sp. SCSIO W1101]UZJ40381.1 Nif11-like leader peptide family RiPP precursor [Prosthecochloris sp. SCSIO W1101]